MKVVTPTERLIDATSSEPCTWSGSSVAPADLALRKMTLPRSVVLVSVSAKLEMVAVPLESVPMPQSQPVGGLKVKLVSFESK